MKRGQVTIYIIIGLIALVAVVLTLYVNQEFLKSALEQKTTRLTQIPQEIQPVEAHIQSCLEEDSKLSLNLIYLQGGYFEPKDFIEMDSFNTAYWFSSRDVSPSLTKIEKEIAISMGYLLPACIQDQEGDYIIDIKKIEPIVYIKDKEVIAEADVDIVVNYKDIDHTLKKTYISSFESPAKDIYDTAKVILESEKKDPDNIDVTLLGSTPYQINFFKFGETIVYVVSNTNPMLAFANRF